MKWSVAAKTWPAFALCLLASCQKGVDSVADLDPYGHGHQCKNCTDTGDGDQVAHGDGDTHGDGDGSHPMHGADAGPGKDAGPQGPDYGHVTTGAWELRADYDGPCKKANDAIDVNLGNTAETAVRALYCQVFGDEPSDDIASSWSDKLKSDEHVRRIDVARTFCQMAGRECGLTFSDPWKAQVKLEDTCSSKQKRNIGAVLMYFSECPNGQNCDMYWANTHALGMKTAHLIYGFENTKAGHYHSGNAGFWRRELLDARWAGLSFFLLNTYGPELKQSTKPLVRAVEALDDIGGGIGIALLDDTWQWGRGNDAPWNTAPDLGDTENAASTLYQAKWKPFFQAFPEKYWYKFNDRPLIYFYNAGTLRPLDRSAAVLARMKQMFADDFGVTPFVAVDSAFFADEGAMNAVADARFTWDTFKYGASQSALSGVDFRHAMVRWDSLGRDKPGAIASDQDLLHKGPELLSSFLDDSSNADIAVIATWNDLGEGTGIHRNYDYFYGDAWLQPNHFLSLIRDSQCDASSSP